MRLEHMQQRLAGAGIGVIGTDLFIYAMPIDVDTGVLLRTAPTIATVATTTTTATAATTTTTATSPTAADATSASGALDHYLPGYRPNAGFQLIVRTTSYEDGLTLVERAVAVATITRPTRLGNYHVNHARPRHDPIVNPRSDGTGWEFMVNFDVNFVAMPDRSIKND